MSVTFSPVVDWKKPINPEAPVWDARWVWHKRWNELPERFKTQEYRTIDEDLWQEGKHPLRDWINFAKKHGLKLFEDFPFKKIFIDDDNYSIALIVTGEPIEHIGHEMQLANQNAESLCNLLGIPEIGSSHPVALLKKIELAKTKRLDDHTRDETDTQLIDPEAPLGLGAMGPRVINFGLDKNKLNTYLQKLEILCDHCIQHECDIHWG